ncbi:hypothetical protein UlMin_015943 [Ulmus minor]
MVLSYCINENKPCVKWVEKYFEDCLCNLKDEFSFAFGLISLVCWGVAEIPQIITNFRSKSGHGVSLAVLLTWGTCYGEFKTHGLCCLLVSGGPKKKSARSLAGSGTPHFRSYMRAARSGPSVVTIPSDDSSSDDEVPQVHSNKTVSHPRPIPKSVRHHGPPCGFNVTTRSKGLPRVPLQTAQAARILCLLRVTSNGTGHTLRVESTRGLGHPTEWVALWVRSIPMESLDTPRSVHMNVLKIYIVMFLLARGAVYHHPQIFFIFDLNIERTTKKETMKQKRNRQMFRFICFNRFLYFSIGWNPWYYDCNYFISVFINCHWKRNCKEYLDSVKPKEA